MNSHQQIMNALKDKGLTTLAANVIASQILSGNLTRKSIDTLTSINFDLSSFISSQ